MTASGFYHCAVKPVGRATGRSAVAAAAYRSGQRLEDERTGLIHDYRAKGGVVDSFIIAPSDAPAWASDRGALWNAVEAKTTAKNGRLATELELALPSELSGEQRRALLENFLRPLAEKYHVAIDVNIHQPGKEGDHRNHHAHVMLTHREIGPEGVGEIANTRVIERIVTKRIKGQDPSTWSKATQAVKTAGMFNAEDIAPTRAAWAEAVNAAYAAAGFDIRVDHRSHTDRGLTAEPTKHLGPAAAALDRRGEATERGDENRAIRARNAQREKIEAERLSLAAAIADVLAERQARADAHALRAAVRSASTDRILEAMTAKRATFTRAELMATLRAGVDDKKEAALMASELLAHPDVIGLRETTDSAVTRYTTRQVLASERSVLDDARAMVRGSGRGLSERQKASAMRSHKHLDEEQRAAFDHATAAGGLAIIAGEAGTGKSTTFAAIRDAYEGAGFRVVGTAWTNSVVQDMKADGFREAATIAATLGRLDRGQEQWNAKTVVMVDEAAMLSSASLGRVMAKARMAGARVILAGDDKQLASIERGGLFSALQAEHGAAELHTVRRVTDAAQQRAFNHMHAGQFGAALDIFDQSGAIRWTDTQDQARASLVAQWAADSAAAPAKTRFVFAYSNADVDSLNADLRAIRRERGELGADHRLQTKDGPADFAAGDRVQFTGSAYYAADKAQGLVTGGMGTLKAIDGSRVTVELDGRGGHKGRTISFTVGEADEAGQFNAIRHGYAGTIYKGQGRTLDQSYLYHSQNWRAASAYVALSRHRERTALFVAREVTSGGEPWTMQTGGLEQMDPKQQGQADKAYQAWAEANPGPAARYGLAEYVAYVQDRQAERGRSAYDMDQLTRQIGRTDETRAASQFVIDGDKTGTATGGGGDGLPRLSGPLRLAALQIVARDVAQKIADPMADLMARVPRGRRVLPANRYDVLRTAEAQAAKATPPAAPLAPTLPAARGRYADLATPANGAKPGAPADPMASFVTDADRAQRATEQAAEDRQRKPRGPSLDF